MIIGHLKANRDVVPSHLSRLDRTLYHPIWIGQTRHCLIIRGLAGQDIVASQMEWPGEMVRVWKLAGPSHS
jgi:hypothetical protein